MSEFKHDIQESDAKRIAEWIKTRGGIAVWPSINLSDLGRRWTTPWLDEHGEPTKKPHWGAANAAVHITDPAEVEVIRPLEVRRFHVAVRMSGNGMSLKLTDASSAKVRKAVARAAERSHKNIAWHEFDFLTQEAVIFVPDARPCSLKEWVDQHEQEPTKA